MTALLTPLPSLSDLFAQLRATPELYDPDLLDARRCAFVAQIQQRNADPRSAEQINMDEWQADWRATNESNRPE